MPIRPKPPIRVSFLVLCTVLLGTAVARCQDDSASPITDAERQLVEQVDKVLSTQVEHGFAGVILIRHRDRELIHRAYGLADRTNEVNLTVEHAFDIGSIVKPITAAAIFKLGQQGKLSTDDKLKKYFPAAPSDKADITIGQLLRHESGMPDIFGGDYQVVDRKWFLEKAFSCQLKSEPGTERSYSNAGYSLLAVIVEEITGQPYEQFVNQQIIRPAGPLRIGYRVPNWQNSQLAVGYRVKGQRWGTPLDHAWAEDGPSWNLRGNGGMLSTAADLCTWYEAVLDGKVLAEPALNEYLQVVGQRSRTTGKMLLGHAGGNGIFNSLQVSFLGADLHLTFLTSVAGQNAEKFIEEFRDPLFELARLSAADDSGN